MYPFECIIEKKAQKGCALLCKERNRWTIKKLSNISKVLYNAEQKKEKEQMFKELKILRKRNSSIKSFSFVL